MNVIDTRAALLAAIIAAPDDDLPRLAYADWCEEHGDGARAEFVRVQVELAKHPHCPATFRHPPNYAPKNPYVRYLIGRGLKPKKPCGRCPVCIHRRREWELLPAEQDRTRAEWTAFAAPGDDCWWKAWDFRRGFVEEVALPWDAWRAHAPALLAAAPLRLVRLTTWPRLATLTVRPDRLDFRFEGSSVSHALPADGYRTSPAEMLAMLGLEYPGVKFELPSSWPPRGGPGPYPPPPADPQRAINPKVG